MLIASASSAILASYSLAISRQPKLYATSLSSIRKKIKLCPSSLRPTLHSTHLPSLKSFPACYVIIGIEREGSHQVQLNGPPGSSQSANGGQPNSSAANSALPPSNSQVQEIGQILLPARKLCQSQILFQREPI